MASSTVSSKDDSKEQNESYTSMSVGDVEAIGAHCQAAFCNQLDFLPFKCGSCKGKFCLDHRTESAHACSHAGAWARARANRSAFESNAKLSPKPTILNHESQCSAPSCRTLINTPLVSGIECAGCNRSYCLKHRMKEDHECDKLPHIGARAQSNMKGFSDAFSRFKMFNASKKQAALPHAPSGSASQRPTNTAAAAGQSTRNNALQRIISPLTAVRNSHKSKPTSQIVAVNALKASAKGKAKVPQGKEIYLHVKAVASGEGASGARIPDCGGCFSVDWSVGKMLDEASNMLSIRNENNRGGGEEQKLRIYHIEAGRLLRFSDKVGASGLDNGHTIVLLRGIGDPDAV